MRINSFLSLAFKQSFLQMHQCNATQVDVYSFAVVMFEIWARCIPWEHVQTDSYIDFIAQLHSRMIDGMYLSAV